MQVRTRLFPLRVLFCSLTGVLAAATAPGAAQQSLALPRLSRLSRLSAKLSTTSCTTMGEQHGLVALLD